MSEICSNLEVQLKDLKAAVGCTQDDVVKQREAHAYGKHESVPRLPDNAIPQKKRKTRRGKSKRKQPYVKNRVSNNVVKPEAPYNSNQFLLEDHGNIEELDEKLKHQDEASSSTVNRTRDSSFSVDSDGEFYSSPDDEEQFLIKDFDYQYETLHAERLNDMTKADLIQEYLSLEDKVEILTSVLRKKSDFGDSKLDFQMELERLKHENEGLKEENFELRRKLTDRSNYSSSDSESDSSNSSSQCDIRP